MTLEQLLTLSPSERSVTLLNASADELDALSDKDLETIFMPFFRVTRPEFVTKAESKSSSAKPMSEEEKLKKQKLDRAKKLMQQFDFV